MALNVAEQSTLSYRFNRCDGFVQRADVVFAYPKADFKGGPETVADALQAIADYYKAATGVDPTAKFASRCVVAYRHREKERGQRECCPGWGPNWVNIPWSFLSNINQPLECATHEIAHPFVELLLPAGDRAMWTEGLCDFLRVGGFAKAGNPLEGRKREMYYIAASAGRNGEHLHDTYHAPAGRLLKSMRAIGLDPTKASDVRLTLENAVKSGFTIEYGPVP